MGRKTSWDGYTFRIKYVVGFETTGLHTEEEAMQRAVGAVDRMRREGAASKIRHFEIRPWGDHFDKQTCTYPDPPRFEASYYDPEQGLTDAEVYSARVHDWHAKADEWNRRAIANNSKWGMGYRPWSDAWGPKPDSCPVCDAELSNEP
jgi:hypothetical protein